jgi:hypothetical protein
MHVTLAQAVALGTTTVAGRLMVRAGVAKGTKTSDAESMRIVRKAPNRRPLPLYGRRLAAPSIRLRFAPTVGGALLLAVRVEAGNRSFRQLSMPSPAEQRYSGD